MIEMIEIHGSTLAFLAGKKKLIRSFTKAASHVTIHLKNRRNGTGLIEISSTFSQSGRVAQLQQENRIERIEQKNGASYHTNKRCNFTTQITQFIHCGSIHFRICYANGPSTVSQPSTVAVNQCQLDPYWSVLSQSTNQSIAVDFSIQFHNSE